MCWNAGGGGGEGEVVMVVLMVVVMVVLVERLVSIIYLTYTSTYRYISGVWFYLVSGV